MYKLILNNIFDIIQIVINSVGIIYINLKFKFINHNQQ